MQYRLVYIKDIPVYARLADTPELRARGLMGVAALEPNEGCLFVFGSDEYTNFWMKNCKINLQTATISKEGRIIDIHNMHYTNPNVVHKSSQPVAYVLEMPENFFSNNGISVGDSVKFEY